jgi:arylformamidase
MKIHDVSLTIRTDMTVWPGDPKVELFREKKIEDGANANVSFLGLSVHTGTHVDAPYHFLPDGITIEKLPLDVLVGRAQVVELADNITEIDEKVIMSLPLIPNIERILFKTRNSKFWLRVDKGFHTDFIGINEVGAKELVKRNIRLVGIDYLSIAPYKKSRPTHEVMLNSKMIVIEGLDLSDIKPGLYTLYCLPLKLEGSDGAPARAILIED